MSFGRAYTTNERAIIARHQRARVHLRETAEALGRTYTAVKNYASDNGILQPRPKPWTPEDDDRIRAMARAGLSVRAIQAKLGRTGVWQRLNRIGIKFGSLREGGHQ